MTTINAKAQKANSLISRKAILTTSATAMIMALGVAPAAQAQTNTAITNGQTTTVANPAGGMVSVAAGVTQTVTSGDNIELEDNSNDGSVITNSGTLINNDGDDEDVVVFIDNSEDDVVINNTATGVMQGLDGVIFGEGDALTLTNAGLIEGTGAANEGVVYFDRDADGGLNLITNSGTITGVGGPTIGIDALLGTVSGDEDDPVNDPVSFGGTSTVEINNTGTISNTGTGSNADAINFNGDPGNTSEGSLGGSSDNPRGCLETITGSTVQQVNCQFNFTLENSGTISAASTDSGSAAIRSEQDAVITGSITNLAAGTITGASNGIFINGAHADHDLDITNEGVISGTAGDGLVITGGGIDVINQATGTISGTNVGLLVDSTTITVREATRTAENNANIGGSVDTPDVAVAAINNTFFNAGTISGGTASVDLSGAGEAVTFVNAGGTLDGDFLGSLGFADTLNITTGVTHLEDDVLQNVNVVVDQGGILYFGAADGNTINGNLDVASGSGLIFNLANAASTVTGNAALAAGSNVTVNGLSAVTAIDQSFTLLNVDGTLTNGSTLVLGDVLDESFLLDFQAVTDPAGNLAVVSSAAVEPEPEPAPEPEPEPEPEPTGDPVADAQAAAAAAATAATAAQLAADESAAAADQAALDADAAASASAAASDDAGEAAATTAQAEEDAAAAAVEAEAAAEAAEVAAEAAAAAAAAVPVIPSVAASAPISDLNQLTFNTAVRSAFNSGGLNTTEEFTALGSLATEDEVNAAIASFLPDTNDSSAQQVLEVVGDVGRIVDRRIASLSGSYLACGTTLDAKFDQNNNSNRTDDGCVSAEQGVWAQGGYRKARQSSSSNNGSFDSGYNADIINFAVGLDQALSSDTLIGVSASYSNLDIDQRNSTSESDIDVYQVTLYGSHNYGNFNVTGQASYALGEVSAEREGVTGDITGDYNVDGFNIQGLATYDFELDDNAYIAPLVGLQYGDFSTDSFREQGGLNLLVGSGSTDSFEGTAGVITGRKLDFSDSKLDVYVRAAYVYKFSGGRDDLDVSFANQTTTLSTFDGDDQRAEGALGFVWAGKDYYKNFRLGAAVDGEAGRNYTSVGASFNAKYTF